jgi:hypothetical protein
MEGVDKEKVQKVIYQMSKGSKYFENEQRKEALTKQKIEYLRAQCATLTDNDISHFQKVWTNISMLAFVCHFIFIICRLLPPFQIVLPPSQNKCNSRTQHTNQCEV